MRIENAVNLHNQPGDPYRAGKVIMDIVSSGNLPKHLPLGSDAVEVINTELERRISEVKRLSEVSSQSDYRQEDLI